MTDVESSNQKQGMYTGYPPSNKYSALPRIGASLDSAAGDNNRLVPYVDPHAGGGYRGDTRGDMDERMRLLETRLVVTEKSNRALLDEVVRLQNELLSVTRKNEESLREERQARKFMENNVRSNQSLVSQMASRLKSTEDQVSAEKHQLSDLLSQARSMEQQLLGATQDSETVKERYIGKVSSLEQEVEEINRDRQKLERISFQLVDEMRNLKAKLEAQGYDFSSVTTDLRSKSKRLEEDYQQNIENMRKHLERQSESDQSTSHIKASLESRLGELKDIVTHLRNRHEDEVAERRSLEQTVNARMSEFNRNIAEQNRLREEQAHHHQTTLKEMEHKAETNKMYTQNRIGEMTEEINAKLLEKEIRLRDEQIKRHTDLEKIIRNEQEARIGYERELRNETERNWENVKRLQHEEIQGMKDQHKHDRDKYHESVRRLDEAVGLLEKQIEESKKEISRVLSAEIKTRSKKDRDYSERLDELEEKISAATSALQQAIGGVANNVVKTSESNRKMMNAMLDDYRKEIARQMGDLDARILGIQNRMTTIDEQVDAKVSAATVAMSANIREKVESISLWQSSTQASITDLRTQKQLLQDELNRLQEGYMLMKAELQSRVGAEIDGRIQDVDSVRREVEILRASIPKEAYPTQREMDQCQGSIRRLAESMQTVKTVLGMKIQSEQKLRLEEVKNLQDEVIRIRSLIEPLIHMKMQPRLFVKPDEENSVNRDVTEMAAPSINRWSIYTAYRWLTWKSKWMYVKWALSNRRQEGQKGTNSPVDPWAKKPDESLDARADRLIDEAKQAMDDSQKKQPPPT